MRQYGSGSRKEPYQVPSEEASYNEKAILSTNSRIAALTEVQKQFWSYQPLQNVEPPVVQNQKWVQTPVDRFILAKLEERGITPSRPADKRILIRRAYFDLIGLPPEPDRIEQFLQDDSPDAFAKVVDELLLSPHFGERWARHWLDVARYADSGGYEFDVERPEAYPYRDFVIQAFNQDLPFDQFLQWQLAGDEMEPENPLALAATGFCTSGPTISNQVSEQNRYDELDDILATTFQGMLGLTVNCARCHDHKYDPISHEDYHRLLAFFTSSERKVRFLADQEDIETYESLQKDHEEQIRKIEQKLDDFLKKHQEPLRIRKIDSLPISVEEKVLLKLPVYDSVKEQKELLKKFENEIRVSEEELNQALSSFEQDTLKYLRNQLVHLHNNPPQTPKKGLTLTDKDADPVLSFWLERGDVNSKKALVKPGFLPVLSVEENVDTPAFYVPKPARAKTTYLRSALAKWMLDTEQGAGALAARVFVNRIWQHLLGEGLVRTPNDFGLQGERPLHPELLDWLAQQLVHSGSIKEIIRLITASSVYQQGYALDEVTVELDPDNRYFSRPPLKRMESEILRDSMLAISGNLNPEMFGPGIKPWMHPDAIATGSTDKWPKNVVDGPKPGAECVYLYPPFRDASDANGL